MKRNEFVEAGEGRENAYITLIIDESGSMESVKSATVSGINEHIQQLKKDFGGENKEKFNAIVSLIRFSSTPTPVFMFKDIDSLQEIAEADYNPNGYTAMYDAVGFAINELKARADINAKNSSSLVIVVSDGQENASREMNAQTLADTIGKLNETKRWTFTYLGANQDLSKVSKATNISYGNVADFDSHSLRGVTMAFSASTNALHEYSSKRKMGVMASTSFYANADTKSDADPADDKDNADTFGNAVGKKSLV